MFVELLHFFRVVSMFFPHFLGTSHRLSAAKFGSRQNLFVQQLDAALNLIGAIRLWVQNVADIFVQRCPFN